MIKPPLAACLISLLWPLSLIAEPTVYVPLGSANLVVAIDANSDSIISSYQGVENPHGLVATPDGEYLVAGSLMETAADGEDASSKLFLIHPGHGHVMQTIPVGGWTHHQAITPNGRYVISTHATRGDVSVLDMQTNQIVRRIETGPAPNYTLITRDGRRAFVSNSGSGTITEIDLTTWEPMRILDAGPAPEHMVFSADEKTIYVTNPRAGTVSAISVESGKVLMSYAVGPDVHGLDMGDDGRTLFVSSKKAETLTAIDSYKGDMRTVSLSPSPYHLNVIPGTGKVYISSRKKPVLWVVDQNTLELITTIDLPAGEGHQMAVVR